MTEYSKYVSFVMVNDEDIEEKEKISYQLKSVKAKGCTIPKIFLHMFFCNIKEEYFAA